MRRMDIICVALFTAVLPCFVQTIPWKDCRKPLFLERYDPTIYLFSASSTEDDYRNQYPYLQRPVNAMFSGWCPDFSASFEHVYLQADLGMITDITGFATQGEGYYGKYWTTMYTLNFSVDGYNFFADTPPWEPYNAPSVEDKRMVFSGNNDSETVITHWFPADRRITARFVRVVCLSCSPGLICCLRFELFGCDGDTRNPVGLIHGQFSPRYVQVNQHYLFDKEYIYAGQYDLDTGWTVPHSYYVPPTLELELKSLHLLSAFSVRGCKLFSCTPLNIEGFIRNNTDHVYHWIRLRENFSDFFILDKESDRNKIISLPSHPVGNSIKLRIRTRDCYPPEYGFCMRLEFYGKDLECKTPFGVEWGYHHDRALIKNEQMTASSNENGCEPHFGRLYYNNTAWCPHFHSVQDQYTKQQQYLQIDFIFASKITGVSTQGFESHYVESYHLYYALDINIFHCFVDENGQCKLFEGNSDGDSESTHWLNSPIISRYLRFNPKKWVDFPCLRVEVYGCNAGTCYTSLGMEYGMISNMQIKASSETQANKKDWSRLNSLGWCAGGNETYVYLQIDLLTATLVTGVATQEKYESRLYHENVKAVNFFYLRHNLHGDKWLTYHTLLKGVYSSNKAVQHWLDPPFVAQHVQFNPTKDFALWRICMRVDIYGCYTPELFPGYLTLGIESFSIGDSQLTASSQQDIFYGPECARLNHYINNGAWVPKTSDASQFLQIDTGWIVILTGIAIQGHPTMPYHTTAFQIRITVNLNQPFQSHLQGKPPREFLGNDNEGNTIYHSISPSPSCRYIQIRPVSWADKIALRVELYGYEADCLKRIDITAQKLSSSSSAHHYSGPEFGHLNRGLGYGAWCAAKQDKNQYLQVDLLKVMFVSGVATQGCMTNDSWVRSYKFVYRGEFEVWTKYMEADTEQEITANWDRNTLVLHFFSPLLLARFVRFLPQSWENEICMRIELYGCSVDQFPCAEDGGCGHQAVCMALDKQHEVCVCSEGYHGDGIICEDLDECASDSASPCPEHTDCVNTKGSFTCNCRPGFTKEQFTCEDVNECDSDDVCPSHMKCINTFGSYTCDCTSGKKYNAVDKTCIDVDECSVGAYICHHLASCINTFGSYYCACPPGYRGRGKTVCTDVNECRQTPNPCGHNSICHNSGGGYLCSCKTGYVREANKCVDYDECSNKEYECQRHTTCVNVDGSYKCQCKQGFFHSGPYCIDLNECLGKQHRCDVNAWCINTAGSYRCFCKKGYQGDGVKCLKQEIPYCESDDENCER